MINVSITNGCNQDAAEQFNEGADTYVRVCDVAGANLIVFSEERCIVVVRVEGEETLRTVIESNQSYQFPCGEVLKVKRSRSLIAKEGFLALFGGSKPAPKPGEDLSTHFVVEIRQTRTGAPLEASYNFRLLSDQAFDQRFAGYLNARVVEEPKPVFTRDARPITCLANDTKCLACGSVITDCIAGCENGDCPTVTATANLKATGNVALAASDKGGEKGSDKGDKPKS
jgi:hypothetical protein